MIHDQLETILPTLEEKTKARLVRWRIGFAKHQFVVKFGKGFLLLDKFPKEHSPDEYGFALANSEKLVLDRYMVTIHNENFDTVIDLYDSVYSQVTGAQDLLDEITQELEEPGPVGIDPEDEYDPFADS